MPEQRQVTPTCRRSRRQSRRAIRSSRPERARTPAPRAARRPPPSRRTAGTSRRCRRRRTRSSRWLPRPGCITLTTSDGQSNATPRWPERWSSRRRATRSRRRTSGAAPAVSGPAYRSNRRTPSVASASGAAVKLTFCEQSLHHLRRHGIGHVGQQVDRRPRVRRIAEEAGMVAEPLRQHDGDGQRLPPSPWPPRARDSGRRVPSPAVVLTCSPPSASSAATSFFE